MLVIGDLLSHPLDIASCGFLSAEAECEAKSEGESDDYAGKESLDEATAMPS